MNQIVISKALTNHGKTSEVDVIVLESQLSFTEFDSLFRNTLSSFFTRWHDLHIQSQKDLKTYQQFEEGMKGYDEALNAFTLSFDELMLFEKNHSVWNHGDFKLLLSSFLHDNKICDLLVLSLSDWLSIKKAESSVGFRYE